MCDVFWNEQYDKLKLTDVGSGGYGKVYKTFVDEREKILKICPRGLHEMYAEIVCLAKLKHENIVSVYKIIVYPHRVELFMEVGRNTNEFKHKHFSLDTMLRDVCLCTLFLHSNNILVIDLKKENLIYLDHSKKFKLIDLGGVVHTDSQYTVRSFPKKHWLYHSTSCLNMYKKTKMFHHNRFSDLWGILIIVFDHFSDYYDFSYREYEGVHGDEEITSNVFQRDLEFILKLNEDFLVRFDDKASREALKVKTHVMSLVDHPDPLREFVSRNSWDETKGTVKRSIRFLNPNAMFLFTKSKQ